MCEFLQCVSIYFGEGIVDPGDVARAVEEHHGIVGVAECGGYFQEFALTLAQFVEGVFEFEAVRDVLLVLTLRRSRRAEIYDCRLQIRHYAAHYLYAAFVEVVWLVVEDGQHAKNDVVVVERNVERGASYALTHLVFFGVYVL